MKCIYAISSDAFSAAKTRAERYAKALWRLSDDVFTLGDDLNAFADAHSVSVLKLDDDDWTVAMKSLSDPDVRKLAGELFLSAADAQRLQRGFDEGADTAWAGTLSGWIGTQADQGRAIVLLCR